MENLVATELIYSDHFLKRWRKRFSWRNLDEVPAIIEGCKIPSRKAIRKLEKRGQFFDEPDTPNSFWIINSAENIMFLAAFYKKKLKLITVITLKGYNYVQDN